jgi:hypothetical protein
MIRHSDRKVTDSNTITPLPPSQPHKRKGFIAEKNHPLVSKNRQLTIRI